MSRFGVSDHLISMHDCILCYFCETRVAFIEDFIPNVRILSASTFKFLTHYVHVLVLYTLQADDLVYGGYINRLFHYSAPINHQGHLERRDGNTLLNIYCVQCQMWFGWRLVRTIQQSEYFVVGRYFMKLELLIYQSGETLRDAVFGVANEQAPNGGANAVQNGVANEQAPNGGANAVQNGVANEQAPNGGANAVQNGVANEQAPNGGANAVQNGVANEQAPNGGANAVQNGVANEQAPNGGANADQNGVANEQAPNGGANAVQNGVANEQAPNGGANADQNGVANEQAPNGGANAVQNGVANEQAPNGGANAVQNGVANEQAPNGGANAVQNGVANEQNRGQHRAGIVRPRRLRPRWNRPY
ncbi:hypothetical protein KY285_028329 [Solanum tuberosum]|nr:hypothetical protein KY285_028329 [Solanum tuberosum]